MSASDQISCHRVFTSAIDRVIRRIYIFTVEQGYSIQKKHLNTSLNPVTPQNKRKKFGQSSLIFFTLVIRRPRQHSSSVPVSAICQFIISLQLKHAIGSLRGLPNEGSFKSLHMKKIKFTICLLMMISSGAVAQKRGEMSFTSSSPNANKILRNAWVALADFNVEEGNKYTQALLNEDPECGMAYASLYPTSGEEADENLGKAVAKNLSSDEKMFVEGLKAGRENKSNEGYFEPLIKKYPSDYYLQLWIILNNHDKIRAIEIGENLVKRNPKLAPAYNMLGYLYMNRNEMTKAENYFNKYVSLRPDLANPYDSKADYLMHTGKIEEAIPLYEKAAALGMTVSKTKADRARARLRFPEPSMQDASMIQEITAAAFAGYKDRNVDDFVKHQAEQALEIFPDQRVNIGRSNIRARASNSFKNVTILKNDFKIEPIKGAGPIAVTYGKATSVVKENTSGKETAQTYNMIFLFRKEKDANWKILANHFYGWNEDGQPLSSDDKTSINSLLTSWDRTLKVGEPLTESTIDKFSTLYSPQAVEIFSNLVSNVGLPNLQARWRHFLGATMETNSLNTIAVEGVGRKAVAWGIGNQNFYLKDSDELRKSEFPWVMILTKEPDDAWRILALHWGAD